MHLPQQPQRRWRTRPQVEQPALQEARAPPPQALPQDKGAPRGPPTDTGGPSSASNCSQIPRQPPQSPGTPCASRFPRGLPPCEPCDHALSFPEQGPLWSSSANPRRKEDS